MTHHANFIIRESFRCIAFTVRAASNEIAYRWFRITRACTYVAWIRVFSPLSNPHFCCDFHSRVSPWINSIRNNSKQESAYIRRVTEKKKSRRCNSARGKYSRRFAMFLITPAIYIGNAGAESRIK